MWAANGNHGDRWSYASVILSNTTPFRVTFQAEVGGDVWTDIALDDISFTTECVVGGKSSLLFVMFSRSPFPISLLGYICSLPFSPPPSAPFLSFTQLDTLHSCHFL